MSTLPLTPYSEGISKLAMIGQETDAIVSSNWWRDVATLSITKTLVTARLFSTSDYLALLSSLLNRVISVSASIDTYCTLLQDLALLRNLPKKKLLIFR
jgi:hypothetical protein